MQHACLLSGVEELHPFLDLLFGSYIMAVPLREGAVDVSLRCLFSQVGKSSANMTALDELTPSIDIEDFFIHITEATEDEGWINVQDRFQDGSLEHDGRICYRFSGCGSCMTRLQFVVDTTLPASSLLIRPEVSMQSITDVTGLLAAEWQEQLSPGDAIVRVNRREQEAGSLRLNSMRQILESPSQLYEEDQESPHPQQEAAEWDEYFARMIVRRDVPEIGMAAMLVMPLGRRHTVVFQVGPVKAYTLTVQPHSEPGKVIVSHVMFLPFSAYPVWATEHFSSLSKLEKNRFERYVKLEDLPKLCEVDRSFYTILHLRGCNRGVPLLPIHDEQAQAICQLDSNACVLITGEDGLDSYWMRWTEQNFTFRTYLQEFLSRSNIRLNVYTELSGRKLVPYQVAVSTQEWDACKHDVLAAFHKQQRAYRRMNGGVSAPRVGEATEARFQHLEPKPKKLCFASTSADVVVRRTFIDMLDSEWTESGSRQGWVAAYNQVGGALIRASSAEF